MPVHKIFSMLLAATALLGSSAALAHDANVSATTTTTTAVAPGADGAVVYESHRVTAPATAVSADATAKVIHRPVVFYYYDVPHSEIVAASTMSQDIFKIWDTDGNGHISPQEYYNNQMVMYEPVETETKIFSDIDADGRLELAREEYTLRLQRLPSYSVINTDGKAGISVHEFVGAGFQEADDNDDNQVSYSELVEAFYGQPRLASEPEAYNQ